MKKFLTLLLIMSMLLALTACKKDKESHESTGTSTSITQGINSSTKGTHDNAGGETNPQQSTPSQDTHTHSYTAEVTAEATCNTEGTKTFTCSCGDSYTEKITATGHSWDDWKVKSQALVDKTGTEQRVCSVCFATETKDSTKNAVHNSFFDGGLVSIICNDYGSVNGFTLLHYARYTFDEYIDKAVAADTIFAALSERFAYGITDDAKQLMKDSASWQGSYDAQSDTFTLYTDASDPGELKLLGYVHNGGNKYITYYSFTPHGIDTTLNFAVELEYNRANGKPNRYLSIGRTDVLPNNMIKSE